MLGVVVDDEQDALSMRWEKARKFTVENFGAVRADLMVAV
jgi:hypothetical protein